MIRPASAIFPVSGGGAGREIAPLVGRGREQGVGAWWYFRSIPGHWCLASSDPPWTERTVPALGASSGTGPPSGRPQGNPEKVRVHDFVIPELGRAAPYGVYDLACNTGWVSVGVDHDTASFAVETIRRWWYAMGQEKYPRAERLLITADGGGSNGSRVRLWKLELQRLADETGLVVAVSHFPPGTSKWNKIEHRLFAFISKN